jgi:hypothetical protein
MSSMEERLRKLEHQVIRYRNMNLFLGLLLIAVFTTAATGNIPSANFNVSTANPPTESTMIETGLQHVDSVVDVAQKPAYATKVLAQVQDVIQTRRLQIVNSAGHAVVDLAVSTADDGLIFVNSSQGKTIAYIGSSSTTGNGLVGVNTSEENNLISLGSSSDGDGYIDIRNRNEERLLSLRTSETDAHLRVSKTGGQDQVFLGGNTNGDGSLFLSNGAGARMISMWGGQISGNMLMYNSADKNIIRLGSDSDGKGWLKVNSKTGTELIYAGSNTDDDGLFRVSNRFGVLETYIIGGEDNGLMILRDKNEKPIVYVGANDDGQGLMQTRNPAGILNWSSDAVQTSNSSQLRGDMDQDGDVDGDDFLLFTENFGKR